MPGPIWTNKEKAKLRKAVKLGLSTKEMLESRKWFANKTRFSIQGQKRRLAIADPLRSAQCKNKVKMSDQQLACFDQFLKENYTDHTPEELATIWNDEFVQTGHPQLKLKFVRDRLQTLGIKKSWKEVWQMPGSIAKRKSEQARQRIKTKRSQQADAKQARAEAEEMLRIRNENIDVEQLFCVECQKEKPLTPVFWQMKAAQIGKARKQNNKIFCIACRKRRRRAGCGSQKDIQRLTQNKADLRLKRRLSYDHHTELITEKFQREAQEELSISPEQATRCCIDCDFTYPCTNVYYAQNTSGRLSSICRACVKFRNQTMRRMRASGISEADCRAYRLNRRHNATARMRERQKAAVLHETKEKLDSNPDLAHATCRQCGETLLLTSHNWFFEKGKAQRTCRFCELDAAAQRRLDHKLGRTTPDADIWNFHAAKDKFLAGEAQRAATRKQLLQLRKSQPQQIQKRVCKVCKTRWPLAKQFWPVRVSKNSKGIQTRYFPHICRCCNNEQVARKTFAAKWGAATHDPDSF